MKSGFLSIILGTGLLACTISCSTSDTRGFAIVIDQESYTQAQAEIDQYQQVVKSRGLEPILVIDRWGVPDSIRQELIRLHSAKTNPIEGCVFIGDIPVPMLRDAQHMTTAFKMNQETSETMAESSVPSDRYYDSFDLEWDFLGTDPDNSEYFFYSLRADCPQKLRPTIYSARIFPRTNERGNKYEKLRAYMKRVNEADAANNPLDRIFYFSGAGFISESVDARIDEKIEYNDQFPWTKGQQQSIEYIDWKRDQFVKTRLVNQMQNRYIDYAVLHHHGSEDTEYLSEMPDGEDFIEVVQLLKMFLRENYAHGISRGMSKAEIKHRLEDFLEVSIPDSWFDGALDPAQIAADEAFEYQCDLHLAEFANYHPQARFVSLDACYNGSFHLQENIQEGYLFGQGNGTLAVLANSVNVLQDKWVNRYIGLLGLGMRVGHMMQYNAYLEQHLFGDPTFAFTSSADCGFDLEDALATAGNKFWKKQIDSKFPAIQIMAMTKLANSQENCSDILFNKFMTSESGIVRLSAMIDLGNYRDENFVECIRLALSDSHEMTQRFAASMAGHNGDSRLVEGLVRQASRNNTGERIEFDLSSALRVFSEKEVTDAFDSHFPTIGCYTNPDSICELIRSSLVNITTTNRDDCQKYIFDKSLTDTRRISEIRTIRNTNMHLLVPQFLEMLSEPDASQAKVQKVLWEALGWFNLSFQAPVIAAKALEISNDERFDASVRNEALKTYNRVR